jgi:hypothetical protein
MLGPLSVCVIGFLAIPAAAQEVITATSVAPANKQDRTRYALWELLPLGLDDDTATALLGMLRGELKKIVGERLVLSARAVEPRLRKRVDDCEDKVACLAEASGAFGADRAIYGVVTNLGDHYNMNLKLLDVRSQSVVGRETAQLSGDSNQLLQQIEILLYRLIAPDRLLGELALDIVDLDGAEVEIDGNQVGTTPLTKPSIKLGEGKHSLKVSSPVIEDYFTFFDIHYGKTTHVKVDATHIRQLQAELEGARSVGPYGVGLKAGFSTNFGKVATPAFALELGTELPIVLRGLAFSVEVAYGWSETEATADGVDERVKTSVWSLPVMARFSYELPVDPAPYGFVSVGTAITYREISSPTSGREASGSADLAFGAGAGFIWRVGPGGFLAEVSWIQTKGMGDPESVRGNLGGLRGSAGYRLEL